MKEVVAVERFVHVRAIQPFQAAGRADGHGQGHRGVEFNHGARLFQPEPAVERGDLLPVGVLRAASLGVQGRDGGLQKIRPRLAQRHGGVEQFQAFVNGRSMPQRSVLFL